MSQNSKILRCHLIQPVFSTISTHPLSHLPPLPSSTASMTTDRCLVADEPSPNPALGTRGPASRPKSCRRSSSGLTTEYHGAGAPAVGARFLCSRGGGGLIERTSFSSRRADCRPIVLVGCGILLNTPLCLALHLAVVFLAGGFLLLESRQRVHRGGPTSGIPSNPADLNRPIKRVL